MDGLSNSCHLMVGRAFCCEMWTDGNLSHEDKGNVVTARQVCAYTAQTVKKRVFSRNRSITEGDFAWICCRNYEDTE